LPADFAPEPRFEIRAGDLLLTRSNTPDLVGNACVVMRTPPRLMLCDLVYRLRVDDHAAERGFLVYWYLSPPGRYQIEVEARGSSQSMVKVSQQHIRSWLIVLPPPPEQKKILAFLDRGTSNIDALVAKVRQGIDHLSECRAALISAAVTGRIDVRGEAAA
jgi:type I restriction enzyme S subunit